jgi:predicted transcriptional regulator
MPERPKRVRRNRMDGQTVTKSFRLSIDLARAVDQLAATEFGNNKSAVLEQALIDFFNRRLDVRAA